MAYSQSDLGRKFRNGDKMGQASNVEIVETNDGGTILVGYGHAVYAYRSPSGHIIAYVGWKDRDNTRRHAGSVSTVQQFGTLGLNTHADETKEGTGTDAAPKFRNFTPPQLA